MSKKSRLRLPAGFSSLKPKLGSTIASTRKAARLKQEVLAGDISISREALSRIEGGKAWPRPQTLDRLMMALGLDWDAVAWRRKTKRASRPFHDGSRGDHLRELGQALQVGREAAGIGLRDLSAECGLSVSQLSRIERGEVGRSRVLSERAEDAGMGRQHRRLFYTHPVLAGYARAGSTGG